MISSLFLSWILQGFEPYFAAKDVAREWVDIPGLTALVGGEVEYYLCDLLGHVVKGEPLSNAQ